MVNFQLFQHRGFSWGTLAIVLMFFAFTGGIFLITQYLQFVLMFTPFETGIRLMPFIGSLVVMTVISHRLTAHVGVKWVVLCGLVFIIISLLMLAMINNDHTYSFLLICFLIQGAGVGMTLAPGMSIVVEALPLEKVGVRSAVNHTLRQVASTLGVAIVGSLAMSSYKKGIKHVTDDLPYEMKEAVESSIGDVIEITTYLPNALNKAIIDKAQQRL